MKTNRIKRAYFRHIARFGESTHLRFLKKIQVVLSFKGRLIQESEENLSADIMKNFLRATSKTYVLKCKVLQFFDRTLSIQGKLRRHLVNTRDRSEILTYHFRKYIEKEKMRAIKEKQRERSAMLLNAEK
jgi:hypothetical protein